MYNDLMRKVSNAYGNPNSVQALKDIEKKANDLGFIEIVMEARIKRQQLEWSKLGKEIIAAKNNPDMGVLKELMIKHKTLADYWRHELQPGTGSLLTALKNAMDKLEKV